MEVIFFKKFTLFLNKCLTLLNNILKNYLILKFTGTNLNKTSLGIIMCYV